MDRAKPVMSRSGMRDASSDSVGFPRRKKLGGPRGGLFGGRGRGCRGLRGETY